MLRSMLHLGEPQVDTPVSVSSLLNKSDKMPLGDSSESLTVKEASITVQETATRPNDDADDVADQVTSRAAALTESPSGKSAPKLAHRDAPPAAEPEAARSVADKDKDAVDTATDSERAQTEDVVVADKAQAQQDEQEAVNGSRAAATDDDVVNTSAKKATKIKKLAASKEKQKEKEKEKEKEKDKEKEKAKEKQKEDDKSEAAEPAKEQSNGEEAAAEPASAVEANVFEIERLATHRVNKETSTVDFFVEWVGTATSWEPERELQSQVPDLVFEYWDAQGGREKATGLEEFHVFRILDSSVDPPSYRVQWVGYRDTPADTTWESRALLRRVAPIALGLYDSTNKKRTTKGRPGRPSKRTKTARDSDR